MVHRSMKIPKILLIVLAVVVIVYFAGKATSKYMAINTTKTRTPKSLEDVSDLPVAIKCTPGSRTPQESYYSKSDGGVCGAEKLITEELSYKFVDKPDAPLGD